MRSLDTKLSTLAVQGTEKMKDFWDTSEREDVDPQSTDAVLWKRTALVAAVLLALSPFIMVYYVDSIAPILGGDQDSDGRKEAFSRRLEYK